MEYNAKNKQPGNQVQIIQENIDKAEIRELAAKMAEAHQANANANQASAISSLLPNNRPMGIASSINNNFRQQQNTPNVKATSKPVSEGRVPVDDESNRGRFGWTTFETLITGENVHIPYIFRAREKYCAVKMLKQKLFRKSLDAEIYSFTPIRSYYITQVESKLLNEINMETVRLCMGVNLSLVKILL